MVAADELVTANDKDYCMQISCVNDNRSENTTESNGGCNTPNIITTRNTAVWNKRSLKNIINRTGCTYNYLSDLDVQNSVEVQVDSELALFLPSGIYEIRKMEKRPKFRRIAFICLFLAIAGIVGFGYFCPDQVNFFLM